MFREGIFNELKKTWRMFTWICTHGWLSFSEWCVNSSLIILQCLTHKWSFFMAARWTPKKKNKTLWSIRSQDLKCYFVKDVDKGEGEKILLLQNLFFLLLAWNIICRCFSFMLVFYYTWCDQKHFFILCPGISKTKATKRCWQSWEDTRTVA